MDWYYTIDGANYPETGGTAQIVSRLASGLVDSVTMTNPARGTFTKSQLDAANGGVVTLQDAQSITLHDEPTEDQWCLVHPGTPFPIIYLAIPAVIAVGIIGYYMMKRKGR